MSTPIPPHCGGDALRSHKVWPARVVMALLHPAATCLKQLVHADPYLLGRYPSRSLITASTF